MANLLFKLNSVPDDEAEEIRDLLEEAAIDYYETSAGNWGLSFAAIWVKDDSQLEHAQQLIDEYQQRRCENAINTRQALIASGQQVTFWQAAKNHPIRLVAAFIFVLVVLYLSIAPYFGRI